MEQDPLLERRITEFAMKNPRVDSEPPILPELNDDPVTNAINQFGLTLEFIAAIETSLGIPIDQLYPTLNELAGSLGGGLSVEGKQLWLSMRLDEGYSLDEILADAEKYKDSIAT